MDLHVSANKLAEFITARTPQRRRSIVRQQLKQHHKVKKGYAPWYGAFETPSRAFLASGARDEGILLRAIERMKGRTGKPWLDTDSRITAEALKALLALAPDVRALGAKFSKPPPRLKARLRFDDVAVTVTPDMIVRGVRNGKPLIGSLRFYLAKESSYQLGQRGAELVAAMQHRWLAESATGESAPDAGLCLVIECFQGRVTAAPEDHDQALATIARGAREFARLWHALENEEAA